MASPYRTLYHKKTGDPVFTYAASVDEWLALGDYTLDPPDAPRKPPELTKLPTAGREMNRINPIVSGGPELTTQSMVDAHQPADGVEPTEDVKAEAPKKAPPRRRPRASED